MKCYNCESKKLVCDNEIDAYVCQDCGYEHYKQYFFISHSHQDIEKVRIIRNVIEETFFYEPILFFLKCLSDKTMAFFAPRRVKFKKKSLSFSGAMLKRIISAFGIFNASS